MSRSELPKLFGREVGQIHAVGVGGMGLGPLAIYLAARGWRVSGEDQAMSPGMADQLKAGGVVLLAGEGIPDGTDLVVTSSAVKADHSARLDAEARGIPLVRRGELLAEVARERRVVGICGSHGKTTVTAMLVALLKTAGCDAGYVLGGLFNRPDWAPAAVGTADVLILEIDESDGTIANFSPAISVVVNLDWDHADHYADAAALNAVFADLMERTGEWIVGWEGCPSTPQLARERGRSAAFVSYGRGGDFDLLASTPVTHGTELRLGERFDIASATLKAHGEFNALNATAALAVGQLLGVALQSDVLSDFPGVRRRQTMLLQDEALTVIEDYAHHPAEIRSLLESVRERMPADGRLVVVFQPHRFSRTKQFKEALAAALIPADSLHLLDVYSAGESPITGGSTEDLCAELLKLDSQLAINVVPGDTDRVLALLHRGRRPGDWVVFVGAGDIEQAARRWLTKVEASLNRRSEWDEVAEHLRRNLSDTAKVSRDETLANKTTLRVGGLARVYVEPETVADLQYVLQETTAQGRDVYVLGRGSNLLVPDAGVEGVVVSLRRAAWASFEVLADGRVRVGAGLRLKNLCGLAAKAGLSGFEFLEGIPGNVGGALRMNAGAMGGWMFDVVEEVAVIAMDGSARTWTKAELHYGYRHCVELEHAVAVGAVLKPQAVSEAESVGRQIDVYRSKRQESQPREPSAGCIFKNPDGDSAGRLIEACGLKGTRIGDAEVSTVHGNFIINRGAASSAEVIALVRRVRREVHTQTGIELQPEVLLYGATWEELI